jgi:hypothetical protein
LTGEARFFVGYGFPGQTTSFVSVTRLTHLNTASLVRNITFNPTDLNSHVPHAMASNGNMILVGFATYTNTDSPRLYASYDGITFTRNTYIGSDGIVKNPAPPLRYKTNSGLFDRYNIFASVTTTTIQSQVTSFLQLVYLNSIWLASLYSSVSMIYSFDGINWYPCAGDVLTYNPIISSILFNGSNFIAMAYKHGGSGNFYSLTGNTGTVSATIDGRVTYTSIDGITWSTKLLTLVTTGPGICLISTITASSTTLTNGRNDTTPYIPQTIQSVNTIQNNQS